MDRVLNAIDPAYVILVELEIWPNFFDSLNKETYSCNSGECQDIRKISEVVSCFM